EEKRKGPSVTKRLSARFERQKKGFWVLVRTRLAHAASGRVVRRRHPRPDAKCRIGGGSGFGSVGASNTRNEFPMDPSRADSPTVGEGTTRNASAEARRSHRLNAEACKDRGL